MPIALPALGPIPAANLSAQLGAGSYNGLAWGPGTDFHVSKITLDDLPAMRVNDTPRPIDPGTFSGFDFPEGRTFNLDISIIAADNTTFHSDLAALQAAFTPLRNSTLPLYLFGNRRLINCRVRKRAVPYDASWPQRVGTASFEMFAPDPRVYDATVSSVSTGLANPGGGFAFPIAFPITFGSAASGGSFQFTNNGNFPTRPVFQIAGPVTNPVIQNVTSNQSLAFTIVLAVGDVLTVDTDAKTVLLNGVAGRRNALTTTSQWFELAPGISTVTFNAYAYSASPTLSMTARSSWV